MVDHPMKLVGRERMDDGAALEALFAELPQSADWTIGLLTALGSGPDVIAPAAWLGAILQEEEIVDDEASRAKVDLLARLFGAVSETLRTTPQIICPEPDKPAQEAVDFCRGYVRGARMHDGWRNDEVATSKLGPFEALAGETAAVPATDAEGTSVTDPQAQMTAQRERLGSYVADLHAYWQAKRQVVNTTPKVGRNEPCPCGSGKKHKKCCLAKQA
jgi:uncharacterized protein